MADTPSVVLPEWDGNPVPLKDFCQGRSVPCMGKVVKGHYMSVGVAKFSLQKLHQEVYLHSVKMGVKVLAHSVRRIEVPSRRGLPFAGARLMPMEQRLAIPISYQGWFELVSEDGKSARPIASVHELAKTFPEHCLVRENVKAYLPSDSGKMTFDKTRIVPAGERLSLCGDLSLPSSTPNGRVKLLRCIDSKGESLYLSFDQKAIFTPIAGPNDLVGVFNIRDIVRRFRLPLCVKLVQGVRPKVDSEKFTGLVRLDWVYTDETVFMCPIEKNHIRMLPVPSDTPLVLQGAVNHKAVCESDHFKVLHNKCGRMMANYFNTIHLIVNVPESAMKGKTRSSANIFSTPQRYSVDEGRGGMRRSKSKEDLLMDEIEDLYQYVRDGGAPPPNIKTKFSYDSDEESYWEEPAYEPIDEFRARLNALDAGKVVTYHEKYRPTDPARLQQLVLDPDAAASGEGQGGIYGVVTEASAGAPHPDSTVRLPPRSSPATSSSSGDKGTPPPLPPRRYKRSDSSPQVMAGAAKAAENGKVGSGRHSAREKRPSSSRKAKSRDRESSGSSGGHRKNLGRDFKDSDISSRTKGGSSGSGAARMKLQMMYL